jgi:hypothetical protein
MPSIVTRAILARAKRQARAAGMISLLRRTAKIRLSSRQEECRDPARETLEDVAAAARNNDGVVIFAIKMDRYGGQGTGAQHDRRAHVGRCAFADYGRGFTSSLNELASREGKEVTRGGYEIYPLGTPSFNAGPCSKA